jgi:protein tyrosine phosphatase
LKWEDNRSPDKVESDTHFERVSYMVKKIKKYRKANIESPVLVHCSAGCGRTGTLIAIYTLTETVEYQM